MTAQVPDFWRTAVWHPLSVHFPIVLLLLASGMQVTLSFFRDAHCRSWRMMGTGLLVLGTATAWLAIYTGSLADGIVSRELCDPTVLKDHENTAFTTGYVFLAAVVINLIWWWLPHQKLKSLLKWVLAIVLLAGSGFLMYTGHKGATLVYQQGAGVYQPSEDCVEFE
jgi:uncharacterized membrane protein